MQDRLRDPIWQFVGTYVTLVALIVAVLFGLESNLHFLATLVGKLILVILILPPISLFVGLIVPVAIIKQKTVTVVSTIQSFFRSTWGRRTVAFGLLLGLLVLEYIRSRLSLWAVTLFALQLLLLLRLVFQILTSGRETRGATSRLQTFTVYAHLEEGIDTGLCLWPGQRVRIAAVGEISIDKGQNWMRPSGSRSRGPNAGAILHSGTHFDEINGKGLLGALIGWIGENRDKSSFLIGDQCTRMIVTPGNLHLGVNDTRGYYQDNVDRDGKPTFFTVYVEMLK